MYIVYLCIIPSYIQAVDGDSEQFNGRGRVRYGRQREMYELRAGFAPPCNRPAHD
jgi:hypothetical protein